MSIFQHNPPFGRGSVLGTTWVHPIEKTDPAVTGASQLLAKKVFTDVNPRNGAVLSNEIVTCVAVKNTTAAAVLPGTLQTVAGYAGVVDEYLPAAGCPVNEIYWLVIEGPTQQPLGIRVSLILTSAPKPREIVPIGATEAVPETDETNPAVKVTPVDVSEEAPVDGEAPVAAAPEAPAPEVPAPVEPVVEPTPEVPVDPAPEVPADPAPEVPADPVDPTTP
jgi:hypothetical protein